MVHAQKSGIQEIAKVSATVLSDLVMTPNTSNVRLSLPNLFSTEYSPRYPVQWVNSKRERAAASPSRLASAPMTQRFATSCISSATPKCSRQSLTLPRGSTRSPGAEREREGTLVVFRMKVEPPCLLFLLVEQSLTDQHAVLPLFGTVEQKPHHPAARPPPPKYPDQTDWKLREMMTQRTVHRTGHVTDNIQ